MTSITTLEDIVARIGVKMEELAESHKDTERALKEQISEAVRAMKENEVILSATVAKTSATVAETSAKVAEMSAKVAENSAKVAENSANIAVTSAKVAENSANIAVTSAKVAETSANLDYWSGRFGDKIGYLTEKILIPGIRPIMSELGHDFARFGPDKEFYLGKRRFAEVDLFLENGSEAMAVEVKTHLRKDDVEYHLKRLKLLRENEAVSGLKGRVLYSAMAGLKIEDDAREMALGLGMYLIEMVEETKYVNVVKPVVELGKW